MPDSAASLTVGNRAAPASAKTTITSTFSATKARMSEIALGRVSAGRRVDELFDFWIGQRLEDKFHLGDLAPDILPKAVGVGDRERAVAGLADVVPPALERQLALFRREVHRRAFDRLDNHWRDALRCSDGFQQEVVCIARVA